MKPVIVAEIDRLLDHYCDREIAEILNRDGHRTWQNQPFTLKKVAWTRGAYRLQSHFHRLRAKGYLTADEMASKLGVSATTVHDWERQGFLRKHSYSADQRSLYEPLEDTTITKRQWRQSRRVSPLSNLHKVQYETQVLSRGLRGLAGRTAMP